MAASSLVHGLANIVGERHVEQTGNVCVFPADVGEVSAVLALCRSMGCPVVPQGGLTGLVGAAPGAAHELALSLRRMNQVLDVDVASRSILVEAGATLGEAQQAAQAARLRLGLDIGARGSCTIGGNIATNAGGAQVVRHGMTRNLVLGLKAVLADGTVLSSLAPLMKDNAGYDLKQLFIGSEGTLGVVTRARLHLAAAPASVATALLAVPDFQAGLDILALLRGRAQWALSACEIMWNAYVRAVATRLPGIRDRSPIALTAPIYILVECETPDERLTAADVLAPILEMAVAEGLLLDGTIAQSERDRAAMWAIRDGSEIVERSHAVVYSFDVSLQPQHYGRYLDDVAERLASLGGTTLYSFGHFADGNVHCIVGGGLTLLGRRQEVEEAIYQPLRDVPFSSVSAEHGIGLEKKPHLGLTRSAAEIATMRLLKRALDPSGILSPGRVF